MNMMDSKIIVDVLGAFGDGQWYMKENCFPLIHYLDRKRYTPEVIDKIVARYSQYKLITTKRGSGPGEIRGHLYLKITKKGEAALDHYRNMIMRSLEKDPDKLAGKSALTI